MNLLDLVPSFRRQISQYVTENDTDSTLAGYIADGIDALNWRWFRTYVVENPSINTYTVTPIVSDKDRRPVVLMASIIFKGSNVDLAKFRDGDFAYDPQQGKTNPLAVDIAELDKILPQTTRLFKASTTALRGFSNGFNPESYRWLSYMGVLGAKY